MAVIPSARLCENSWGRCRFAPASATLPHEVRVSGYIPVVDRTQITLLPEAVDDFIEPDNPVRVIDAFVNQMDMDRVGFQRSVGPRR